ncbi:MAG: UvrD-helicase domain-containing protein [Actinobacteria bacterium]|nr:UvrD-helicase domain-containing protein [Actinomycetota bacterium]
MKNNFLDDLNQIQKKAVVYNNGPLLIFAGAGTGKTRVITYKVAYLLEQKLATPQEILAITFTNKTANEMKIRVERLIGENAQDIWIKTFHSTCTKILRNEIERLGYGRNFVIYDEIDQIKLVTECMKELDIDRKRFNPKAILNLISAAKEELIDHEKYPETVSDLYQQIASDVYSRYQERLFKANALDFDDLIMLTVIIFRLFPSVLKKYQDRFKYILVDEYQDTNRAQYYLVNLLASKNKNIYVVGDDDQSIYSWRGADIRNILEFEHDYPNAKVIKLEQNYRSTKLILGAANNVVKNNFSRKGKNLWTDNERGKKVFIFEAEDEHNEASFVIHEIKRLIKNRDFKYNDFSVFYRTHAQSRVIEDISLKKGIPYKIVGGVRFYDRMEIKDITAYLRLISNSNDIVSLHRIINVPHRRIGKMTISAISKFAKINNITFNESLQKYEENHLLSINMRTKIKKFIKMIDYLRDYSSKNGLDKFLVEVWTKTGYIKELEDEKTLAAQFRIENLKELLTVVKEFLSENPEGDLDQFLEEMSLIANIDTYKEGENFLTLMTLHNAKGLEFKVVFIVGMEEGIFPHALSLDDIRQLEEERRLCYVGMTRAKKLLYMVYAISRNLYGGIYFNPESRFLREIPDEFIEEVKEPELGVIREKLEKFNIGDRVVHKKWGMGEILDLKEIINDTEAYVLFDDFGLKHLLLNYAKLDRVTK